ncbi:hypothetical protein C8Q73DRAFT_792734 [Cubamyces lactineus]|nr:hypothetical protein C8Q73DRAFT_792734 [Cubamyces lactineus]
MEFHDEHREGLEHELRGKIEYNNRDLLFEMLGSAAGGHTDQRSRPITDSVDPVTQEDRIKTIVTSILENLPDELKTLKTIANRARASPPVKQERSMYEPLNTIFEHIQSQVQRMCTSPGMMLYTAGRHFVETSGKSLRPDDHQKNDNPEKPDFVLVDPFVYNPATWRACSAFFEIKADERDGPTPRSGCFNTIKQTLRQGADHARLIFSSRPHQLHVWGLFLCGNKLTIGRFDRRGVVLSQEYDLQNPEYNNIKRVKRTRNSKTKRTAENEPGLVRFVHIIVRLMYEMSAIELGHDPTVTVFGTYTYSGLDYPSFRISVDDGPAATSWVTISEPIGASLSLFGRGTSVWYVIPETEAINSKISQPTVYILKNAWRPSSLLREYLIYTQMLTHTEVATTPAIARALAGGDVKGDLRGEELGTSQTISIGAIRHSHSSPSNLEADAVLHRVILKDYGIPLYEFRTVTEMLYALSAVGERVLAQAGILHRNISPGNIMIRLSNPQVERDYSGKLTLKHPQCEGPTQSTGFLTGFEFASLPNGEDRVGQSSDIDDIPKGGMTGPGRFTATEVLMSVAQDIAITPTASHDLQSVLWSILYVIYYDAHSELNGSSRSTKMQLSTIRDGLQKEYTLLFSASSVENLLASRVTAFGTCVSAARPHTEATCGGVQHLLMYTDIMFCNEDITDFLEAVWIILRQCQPAFIPTKDHQYADIYYGKGTEFAQTHGSTASMDQRVSSPFWQMSKFALELNHDILEMLLDRILGKVESGSECGDGDGVDEDAGEDEDESEGNHQDGEEEGGDADDLTDRLGALHLVS